VGNCVGYEVGSAVGKSGVVMAGAMTWSNKSASFGL
jgi:hypothetical protein